MLFALSCLKCKAQKAIHDFIHEEKGASDIIAMVVIIGIVVVLAFLFRTAIFNLFKSLWDNLVVTPAGNGGTATGKVTVDAIKLPENPPQTQP